MEKFVRVLCITGMLFLFFGFTVENEAPLIGTYGVSVNDPAQIKLRLNADHTFYYQDFSVSEKRIAVNGTWVYNGKKLFLKTEDHTIRFHKTWTFAESGKVAKSRKGLTFYRLCKVTL